MPCDVRGEESGQSIAYLSSRRRRSYYYNESLTCWTSRLQSYQMDTLVGSLFFISPLRQYATIARAEGSSCLVLWPLSKLLNNNNICLLVTRPWKCETVRPHSTRQCWFNCDTETGGRRDRGRALTRIYRYDGNMHVSPVQSFEEDDWRGSRRVRRLKALASEKEEDYRRLRPSQTASC